MNKPLIGITTATFAHPTMGFRMYTAYTANATAVERAGGLPVLVPCELDEGNLRGVYERLDGVLLPGGGDVDPTLYNAVAHPTTAFIIRERDVAEMNIARWAEADQRPLFAICRGQQVVNVALGGTLIQDVDSLVETDIHHNQSPKAGERDLLAHKVEIEPGSEIHRLMGVTSEQVNSIHHQAIDRLADPLVITARSEDGLIEGAEKPDHDFYVTVQWHPEDLQDMPTMQSLYSGLVEAARKRMNLKPVAG